MTDGHVALLERLSYPIIQAPMAGGPSTVALAAAVCNAGGMGFLASGYGDPAQMREQIHALRAATSGPFGVNVFMPASAEPDSTAVTRYLQTLTAEEERYGAHLAAPRSEDDAFDAFLTVTAEERPAVVSFTFGCPTADQIAGLCEQGVSVWVTIAEPNEAIIAQECGASAIIVQGVEAGGHRGGFSDAGEHEQLGLLPLLRLTREICTLPMIAAGGLIDGAGVAAALCAGASAVQLGTAFMVADEAATHPAHRARLTGPAPTGLTRAFSGRQARGIVNRFQATYTAAAPAAYPQIHYATSPVRAAAREADDADGFNLWAGQAHSLARPGPAAVIVRTLAAQALAAASEAAARLQPSPCSL